MSKKILGVSVVSLSILMLSGNVLAASDPAAVVDTLNVTVEEICTFSRTSGTGSISKAMTANKGATGMGGSTFTAICNAGSGYSVAATFTTLSGGSGSATFAYSSPSKGYNRYSAYLGGSSSTTRVTSGGNIIDTSEADDSTGTSQEIYYKCSTASDVPYGTYTGTATYTLTQK
ncbi:hypothetical protein IJI89_01865 [Candidatus Saccharibacteria bacterium]|nr:hypothetical protein [Candidatus Saccharibacteria bacterium]